MRHARGPGSTKVKQGQPAPLTRSSRPTTRAGQAFPCWDRPIFKIPYQLTVRCRGARGGEQHADRSQRRRTAEDRDVRAHAAAAGYLLALATGPLEFTPVPGTEFPDAHRSDRAGDEAARRVHGRVRAEARRGARAAGSACRYRSRARPDRGARFAYGAMENPRAITFPRRRDPARPRPRRWGRSAAS